MSEYVSMRSINLKNQIMLPEVLRSYRLGNLDLNTIQNTVSPLQEIYTQTYNYIDYPELSDEARNLISLVKPKNMNITRQSK